MTKHCPSCGAETQQGARFCRRCGAPLRQDGDGEVSPQAATVPLRDEGRTTDGLAADDPRRASADTTRVNRDDLQRLLQTQHQQPPPTTDTQPAPLHSAPTQYDNTAPAVGEVTRGNVVAPNTGELATTGDVDEDLGLKTRASFSFVEDDAEELTVVAPDRGSRPFEGQDGAPPRPVEQTPVQPPSQTPPTAPAAQHQAQPPRPAPARTRSKWPFVVIACVVLFGVVTGAALLAYKFLRRPAVTDTPTQLPSPPPDAAQLFDEKLAQAESLLASGNLDAAVDALREANQLVPSNWKAHRRLGELYWESGRRREALEEYRAAADNNPNDFTLWRTLAAAQAAENLPQEAAESYKRLVALVGDANADPADLLAYADALRLSNRPDEARTLYQRLVSAPAPEVASAARQRLAELAQPTPTPSPGQRNETDPRANASPTPSTAQPTPAQQQQQQPTPTPLPTPTPQPTRPADLSPTESYQRGVQLWSSNRNEALRLFRAAAAGGNADAHYYLGLSYVEGKDIGSLSRAAYFAARQHFQNAQRGQHAARARQYEQQLEKEFDRIRNQR